MPRDYEKKSGYVIPQDEFQRKLAYYDATTPYPPEVFIKRLVDLSKRARTGKGVNLGTLLEETAEQNPDRIAIKWDDQDLPLSSMLVLTPCIKYRELNKLVNQYANYFLSIGIKKGDGISALIDTRVDFMALFLAAAKIGAVTTLLNTRWPEKTLVHGMNIRPVKAVVVGEEYCHLFSAIANEVQETEGQKRFFLPDADAVTAPEGLIDLKKAIVDSSETNPACTAEVNALDPCYLIFTSGTTGGPPKAVVMIHKTLVEGANANQMILDLQKNDTVYVPLPFFHNTAIAIGWGPALLSGASIAIRRKFSATHFWDDTRKFRATKICYVGELCRYLMNQEPSPRDTANPVNAMIGNGLSPQLWKGFKERFDIPFVYEFYGASELHGLLINAINLNETVGFSFQNNAVVKYDMENDRPFRNGEGLMEKVGVGETGLLLFEMNTDGLEGWGYTDKKETEKRFVRDVFKKGDVWFSCEDLVRNVGFKHRQFVDRLGDTFRWHSENVSTTEVDAAFGSLAEVYMSTTYGVKIPHTVGRAGMTAVVFSTKKLDEFDFRGFTVALKKELPDFAVPIFIRITDEIEHTASLKFKKKILQEEGFDIERISDPIYVLLPDTNEYQRLTKAIKANIEAGEYRF